MDQGLFDTAGDGAQRTALDGLLSFQGLKPSAALELQSYDIDHFGESERYAGASSMPLSAGATAIKRARLSLPVLTLSLVKTFPRIIRGYDLAHAIAVAVPMDHVTSTRINGQSIGSSILVLKGRSDCLVYEPAGRLWAVAYFSLPEREPWSQLDDGYHLLSPASDVLASLHRSISTTLETAAHDPDFLNEPTSRTAVEQSLFVTMDAAIRSNANRGPMHSTTDSYQRIVAEMERLIRHDLAIWHKTTELAERVGVSVRTLQSATQAICGMSPHRYSRVLRLWSVRKQLRTGPARRSVKACAIGHGFWHLSEFAASYRAAFGELPSETLHRSKREVI
ncbi:helix-turn-helix domain-containing protein [Bradyrhizobium japonicum]|jgi:AraC family ethanolamine operon transcriptional activator|uniref:helix-turn-helix domain-containing protein n=1 Tax=Bradyrhizobium TaxID=374 RepID=UPI000231C09D|nr:helix-turn-helix domain-containing protein [Bradyrhizobium japonicum]KMK00088.1 AraC family transcriptional regulator [Bradyrhizobium japonicum]MBR0732401.1 helix-turn-helix domain-containing protein [Bradyrhizobium japonicum]MBR0763100.1 helix-turn-helix domain-containing protein [Bradyrhizobium japonicum]MBR0807499.1 helix-turn-helix domain-containing protein [Bradyrhizobium japonicum]MCS3534652.1 AraC family ethanolamine operon transcriptional activator [Bradyrhizobium japonicum]